MWGSLHAGCPDLQPSTNFNCSADGLMMGTPLWPTCQPFGQLASDIELTHGPQPPPPPHQQNPNTYAFNLRHIHQEGNNSLIRVAISSALSSKFNFLFFGSVFSCLHACCNSGPRRVRRPPLFVALRRPSWFVTDSGVCLIGPCVVGLPGLFCLCSVMLFVLESVRLSVHPSVCGQFESCMFTRAKAQSILTLAGEISFD